MSEKTNTTFLIKWFFFKYVGRFWPILFILIFINLIGRILEIVYLLLLKPILDSLLTSGTASEVGKWALIYLFMFFPMLLVGTLASILTARFLVKLERTTREDVFQNVVEMPVSSITSRQSGYLLQRVFDDVDVSLRLFGNETFYAISGLLASVFMFLALFTLNVKLAFVALLAYPLHLINILYITPKLQPLAVKRQEAKAIFSGNIQEIFSGIYTLVTMGALKREVEYFRHQHNIFLKAKLKYLLSYFFINGIIPSVLQFPVWGLIVWFGTREIIMGNITIGGFISLFLLSFQITGPINSVLTISSLVHESTAGIKRIYDLIIGSKRKNVTHTSVLRQEDLSIIDAPSIYLKNISFTYENGNTIFKNLSISMPGGKTTVIIGPSGCGKTTLLNLILRLIKPNEGEILINDRALNRYTEDEWLKNIGFITQETFIFNRSILDNILLADPKADMMQIHKSCEMAGLDKEIQSFPLKYDTLAGERGQLLSIGQKQRIGIARLFLSERNILLLDEPTSALDIETERKIVDILRIVCKGKTTVIVTHRSALAELADLIYIMKDGEILEKGTHEDLSESSEFYKMFKNIKGIK